MLASIGNGLNPNGLSWPPRIMETGREVSLEQVRLFTGEILWVDARSPELYAQSHIPGAVNLWEGNFEEHLTQFLEVWSPELKVVIYCDRDQCGTSASLAERLSLEYGLSDIHILKGGWDEWQRGSQ